MNLPLAGLLLAAVLTLLVLGGVALTLWLRVWRHRRERTKASRMRQQLLAGHLRLLAGSLLDEQVPLIEAAIRLKVLLDHYDPQLSQSERCRVFQQLYEACAHIPTHSGWSALDRTERRHFEAFFSALELQHKAAARRGARWLLEEGLPPRD